MACGNSSSSNHTEISEISETIRFIMMDIGVRIVCGFGVLGNILNLIVLTRQKMTSTLTTMEKSAHMGLIALAVSDFMFCSLAIMYTFIIEDFESKSISFYFRMIGPTVITYFIVTSTWLIVVMAVERYVAVCHPFKAREILTLNRTRISIILVYVICALCSIAIFFDTRVEEVTCENKIKYIFIQNDEYASTRQLVWSILADLIPCISLFYLNICLIQSINKSKKLRQTMAPYAKSETKLLHPNSVNSKSSTRSSFDFNATKTCKRRSQAASKSESALNSVTATLIAVVLMFLIFVMPSEIIKFVHEHIGSNSVVVYWITNFMQAVNFSFNFVLYCAINKAFRQTFVSLFLCRKGRLKITGPQPTGPSNMSLKESLSSDRIEKI